MLDLHWAAEGEKHAKGHPQEWSRVYIEHSVGKTNA